MPFFLWIIISFLYLTSYKINSNFIVLPLNTIFMKDIRVNESDYFTNLTQNELYTNFSVGSKREDIKFIIKGKNDGFLIYEKAYDYDNSNSYDTVIDEDGNMKIQWGPHCETFPSKDNLYLPYYNSYKEFREGKKYNLKMTNKTTFLRIKDKNETEIHFFNKMYYNYGIICLSINNNEAFKPPEFVRSLKAVKDINTYYYHFYFENNIKNGFSTNDNKGYFIIGEQLTDIDKKKDEINYINCPSSVGRIYWGLNFSHTFLRNNDNNKILIKNLTNSEIIVNYPYIKGVSEYFKYINEIFFDELLSKNICYRINFTRHEIYLNYDYYGYACDSNSKYFMDKLNNKFPDLIFEQKELNLEFTLTKKDLFAYNTFNEFDTNLYFLIVKGIKDYDLDWTLGIPFLKKYVFSYNSDSKQIGFYKNYGIDIEDEGNSNFFSSTTFKIILIIILIIIVFGLGMLVQNYIKKSRKKRANELEDDNYEYESYNDKKDNKDNNKDKIEDEGLGIDGN